MKKSELRVWALRTHSPDEWWVEVDGEVSDKVVTLDEAFHRAEGKEGCYIIHSSHAEEKEDPHWIKMGVEEPKEDVFGLPKWVCKKCRFAFEKPDEPKVSSAEIVGYGLILPGLLLTKRRKSPSNSRCPHCGSNQLVPGNSKAGKSLLDR